MSLLAFCVGAVARQPPDATRMISLLQVDVSSLRNVSVSEEPEHRLGPVDLETEPSPGYEDLPIWRTIYNANRHSWNGAKKRQASVGQFLHSAEFFEWCTLSLALPIFVLLHHLFAELPSGLALLLWVLVACLYGFIVWYRLGDAAGEQWIAGYVLEFIFSVENVFVFHMIVSTFSAPRRLVRRSLFVVVCFQIVFEMIFYMGLADSLRRVGVLPYVLGLWLIYIGVQAAFEDSNQTVPVQEMLVYRNMSSLLGADRVSDEYAEDGSFVLVDGVRNKRSVVTLLGLLTACLLLVDFFLEVDVTLTKIEELENEYINFTSSVVAAFAVPELFFVGRYLFQRFYLLKFGISFVLVFFGVQMLCHNYFTIPAFVGCAIMAGVLVLCVAVSSLLGFEAACDDEHSMDVPVAHSAPPQDYGSTQKAFRG